MSKLKTMIRRALFRSCFCGSVVFAVSFLAAPRAAADDDVARIWLDAEPQGCLEHWAPLTRNVTLACEATGGKCVVAPSKEAANRFVYLRCDNASNNPIKIEGRSAEDKLRWSADLVDGAGPAARIDDRIRAASVFAARFETQESSNPRPSSPPPSPTRTTTSHDGFQYAPSAARADDGSRTLAEGLMIGGFGVAAAGLIVGISAAVASRKDVDDLQVCRPTCNASDIDSAVQKARVADVALITAAVGAAVGVVGLILLPSRKSTPATASVTALRLGVGSLSGAF